MRPLLVLLLVAQVQPLNGNVQPVLVKDEGTLQQPYSASTINCVGAGITCTQASKTMTVTVPGSSGGGYDGGKVAEAYMADASITAQAFDHDPAACPVGQYASDQSSAGVLTCSTPAGTYVLPDSTSLVTGGVRLTGDLNGTAASPGVVDDSHAHTSSTINALDTGDITTGTLAQARGGTGAGALTCGAGDFLTSNGTLYSCSTPAGGSSPLTTKGDLYTYSTADDRLPTSTDGLCLKTLASTSTGLEWGACSAGGSGLTYAETAWANLGGF